MITVVEMVDGQAVVRRIRTPGRMPIVTQVAQLATAVAAVSSTSSSRGKRVLINVGEVPVEDYDTVITDADVVASSEISARVSRRMPAGVDADEYEMNVWVVDAIAGNGSINVRIRALEGPMHGPLYVSYIVSNT